MLELLVSQHGEIISRDDFIKTIWDGRIVSNNAIDNRIKSVRAALGDDGRRQKFIKTYPNRGYKFIGRVRVLSEMDKPSHSSNANSASPDMSAQVAPSDADTTQKTENTFVYSSKAVLASILTLAALFITAGVLIDRSTNTAQEPSPLEASTTPPRPHNADHLPQPGRASKIAVMPIEVIGVDNERPYLAEIIESELRQAVMAIQNITVVSVSSGNQNPFDKKTIEDATKQLELDYVVRAQKVSLGTEIQLSVQLICNIDNVVLWSKKYLLEDRAGQALSEWPAASAINATIEIANTLEVSINQQANYLVPYAFQEKVAYAQSLIASNNFDTLNEAITILGEVIEEEESYLPAYTALFEAHYTRYRFYQDVPLGDIEIMKDISIKMKRISPNAPETLLILARMSIRNSDGTHITSHGKTNETWQELINEALEKSPNYAEGYFHKASFMSGQGQYSAEDIEEAYDNALRLSPTNPDVLETYVWNNLCSGDIETAWTSAQRSILWNPNSSLAHTAVVNAAVQTGRYEDALKSINEITKRDKLLYVEVQAMVQLYIDLGDYTKPLPYAGFPPARAFLYAMADDTENALKALENYENYYTAQLVRAIALPDETPKNHTPHPYYLDITETIEGNSVKLCQLGSLMVDIYGLSFSDQERSDLLKDLLVKYFDENPLESFQTRPEYTALMSLHILNEDYDKALEVMDIAMDKGFIFIGSFRRPILRRLKTHPGFPERFQIMQERADELLAQFSND